MSRPPTPTPTPEVPVAEPSGREQARRCSGCYDSLSGPWCDNCDQWPCVCVVTHESDAASTERA